MDIHQVRQLLKTKSIYDIPLRVTFYARVSSHQDLIRRNAHWTFVTGYIDKGLSGISTKR